MTDLRKAAEMALEVMEYNRANGTPNMGAAIEALRQALAMKKFSEVNQEIEEALKQPQQEPVAYTGNGTAGREADVKPTGFFFQMPPQRTWVGLENEDVATVKNEFNRGALWAEQVLKEKNKREWVGLTDEEGAEIWGDAHDLDWKRTVTPKEIVKRIEAKLKEKNT